MFRRTGDGRRILAWRLTGAIPFAVAFVLFASTMSWAADNAVDPSDVVLALDYSTSILKDKPVRTKFAGALDEIADRVDATADDLARREITISLVPFGTRARAYPGCERLNLREDPAAVKTLAGCLRQAALEYRRGTTSAIAGEVGADTNYVAALQRAAKDLPADAARPAVILFTDGKHDVAGVPVSKVLPTARGLFQDRPAFALLPVGMGLAAKTRKALQTGLEGLRDITHNMQPCPGGEQFAWDKVVFSSPLDAGHAVATALNEVTCASFDDSPQPTPTPEQAPGSPRDVRLTTGDASLQLAWVDPADSGTAPVDAFQARCRPTGGQAWLPTLDVVVPEHEAVFGDLLNGQTYECQVAASSAAGTGQWAAAGTGTPAGPPGPPADVEAQGGDGSAVLTVAPGDDGGSPITDYLYECTQDGGLTWSAATDPVSAEPMARLENLANGVEYACRAAAANAVGASELSAASNVFRPCSGLIGCNPALGWMLPLLAIVAVLLVLWLLLAWRRQRLRKYVTAYVDDAGTISLGRGPNVGLAFVGDEAQAAKANADVPIRYRGSNEFDVTSGGRTSRVRAGSQIEVVDREGASHTITLRATGTRTRVRAQPADEDDWSATAPATTTGGRPQPPTDDWD